MYTLQIYRTVAWEIKAACMDMYVCLYGYTYVIYVCMHACLIMYIICVMYTCISKYMKCVCTYVCMYVFICMSWEHICSYLFLVCEGFFRVFMIVKFALPLFGF